MTKEWIQESGTRFVCYEGCDSLANGTYGTCLPIETVMDPNQQVLVAYEMNGEKLPPDHGFPVRMVVPGFVGARMVKWLARIWLSKEETNNYYHLYDNRFFTEQSFRPNIKSVKELEDCPAFNEYSINSVITNPEHQEWLPFSSSQEDNLIRGYAYSGGGKPIIRVELSLDSGKTWTPCKMIHPTPEQQKQNAKNWVWCHWELKVGCWQLLAGLD